MFVFVFLIRSWCWLLAWCHRFKESKAGHEQVPERFLEEDVLGGDFLNQLLERMRAEIAGLMRFKCPAEDECSPTPGASAASGTKRKKKAGKWIMLRMPWETLAEGEVGPPSDGYQPDRDSIDRSFRHGLHHHFGHH